MTRLLTLLAAFGLMTACTMNDVDPPSQEAGEAVAEDSEGQIYQ